MNGILLFLFLKGIYYLLWSLGFLLYGYYFYRKAKDRPLPWERLVENEEKRMAFFYRIASLFTDVPDLKEQVKRRKWLDFLLKSPEFKQSSTYNYLYPRTFFRSGGYFGLFIRLTVIGGLFVWALDGSYFAYGMAVLFMYLTGFQLISLWLHHDGVIWPSLYPVSTKIKKASFLKLLMNILTIQNFAFTICFIFSREWLRGLGLFILLGIFSFLFVYVYSKKRIEKRNHNE